MKNNSITLFSVVLIASTLGNISTVNAKEGWYAGFGIGSSATDLDIPQITLEDGYDYTIYNQEGFDDNDLGFAINGGYRLNDNLALNLDMSYTRGDARYNISDNEELIDYSNSMNIDSFYITPGVNLIYPINTDFEVYAKLGLSIVLTDAEYTQKTHEQTGLFTSTSTTETMKDWDITATMGFGGQWNFGENWAATFEYTFTQVHLQPYTNSGNDYSGIDMDTQNILVGLRYRFN